MSKTFVYVSGGSELVRVFELEPDTGTLAPRGQVDTGAVRPGYMVFSPDGRCAYGLGGAPAAMTARVIGFSVEPGTGLLTKTGETDTGARGGTHVAVFPSGRWLINAHFQGGQVSVVAVGTDGTPGPLVQRLEISPEAHQIVIDGPHVFVPCRRPDVIHQFVFDEQQGTLTARTPDRVAVHPGAGPRHMAVHPNGRWAYVVGELDGTMLTFAFDRARGELAARDTPSIVPAGFSETSSAHVVVHPSGAWVFASNRTHGSIAVLAVDPGTGALSLRANETGGGLVQEPRNFTLDPSGRWLLVANQRDGRLLVFRFEDGRLTLTETPIEGLGKPSFVGTLRLP